MVYDKFHDDGNCNLPWQSKLKKMFIIQKNFLKTIKWKIRGTFSNCTVNLVRSLFSIVKRINENYLLKIRIRIKYPTKHFKTF